MSGTGVPTRPDVVGSEKLPPMSLPSPTTILASRSLVACGTSGLSIIGPTTERCMLNDSAVEPQPWAELLGGERPAEQSDASAAELGRDVEPVEAGVTQRGVVLDGIAGVAIVLGGARGEVGGQATGALLEFSLRRADDKLHATSLAARETATRESA